MGLGAARQGISQAPPPATVPLPSFACVEKSLLPHNLTVKKVLKEKKTLGPRSQLKDAKQGVMWSKPPARDISLQQ